MKTNYTMIKELDEVYTPKNTGIVTMDEIYLINNKLCLDKMDITALRNLRDFTVLFLDNWVERYDEEGDRKKAMLYMDKISAITAVIDQKIRNIGGEV